MFYCIDYDSRKVEYKSESKVELEIYIKDNDLELALAIVDSEDELCLQFSLSELEDVYGFLNGNPPEFTSEEQAAEAVWLTLEEHKDQFPQLPGKKIESKSEKQTKPKIKRNSKLNLEASVSIIEGKCKSGSILDTIVKAVEEELCETLGEVRDYILENHVIPKTGELADEKFADHNLKYFIKQGKISIEEEL